MAWESGKSSNQNNDEGFQACVRAPLRNAHDVVVKDRRKQT